MNLSFLKQGPSPWIFITLFFSAELVFAGTPLPDRPLTAEECAAAMSPGNTPDQNLMNTELLALIDAAVKGGGSKQITPLHLAHTLFNQLEGSTDRRVSMALERLGINPGDLRNELSQAIEALPHREAEEEQVSDAGHWALHLALNRERFNYGELSSEGRKRLTDKQAGPDHLLLALSHLPSDPTQNPLTSIFQEHGLTPGRIAEAFRDIREEEQDALSRFTTDLTAQAAAGELSDPWGRTEEIDRILTILSKHQRNWPVVTGDRGVGKTSTIEALALALHRGEIQHPRFRDRRVYRLDVTRLMAGTSLQGEKEERLKNVLDQVKENDGILFIDNAHRLAGTGSSGESGSLKEALVDETDVMVILAAPPAEALSHFGPESSYSEKTEIVELYQPNRKQALTMLMKKVERLANHHRIRVTDPALVAIVRYARRFEKYRNLPGSAVSLLDEVMSRVAARAGSMPTTLKKLREETDGLALEIERYENTLRKPRLTDDSRREISERLEDRQATHAQKTEELEEKKALWEKQREPFLALAKAYDDLEKARASAQEAEGTNKAGILAQIPDLQTRYEKLGKELDLIPGSDGTIWEEATVEDVFEALEARGVKISKGDQDDATRLLRAEEELGKRVMRQDHALSVVANVLRNSAAGINDPTQPLGSVILLGPSGVGKTELAKTLASFMTGSEENMIRFDGSENQERTSVNKAMGSDPGYVGYEEGGRLVREARRMGQGVILFDEIEKFHPAWVLALLKILDEGKVTEGTGLSADLSEFFIIMTGNAVKFDSRDLTEEMVLDQIAQGVIYQEAAQGSQIDPKRMETIKNSRREEASDLFKRIQSDDAEVAAVARDELGEIMLLNHELFRNHPEFVGRVDAVVMMNHLGEKDLEFILTNKLRKMLQMDRLLEERGIVLEIDDSVAKQILAAGGLKSSQGVRAAQKTVDRVIKPLISQEILKGEASAEEGAHRGDSILLTYKDNVWSVTVSSK